MTIVRRLTALLLFVPALAAAQTVIATPEPRQRSETSAGDGFAFAVGQTFLAPTTDTRLDQVSFWAASATPGSFTAYVFAWDAATNRATGPALFTSARTALPTGDVNSRIDIATGGVELTAGQAFVAFLSVGGTANAEGRFVVDWGTHFDNPYAGGRNVLQLSPVDAPRWTTQAWTGFADDDLHFAFAFNSDANVVPEPSTYVLLATGLAGLATVARRRRRA